MFKFSRAISAVCCAVLGAAALLQTAQATIVVNQLDDMPMGTWSGAGDMVRTMNHCVGTSPIGLYRVTATGSGAGGAFTLSNGSSTLAYQVEFAGRTGGFFALAAGVARSGFNGNTQAQCTGLTRQNERVRITIRAADLAAAPAGTYAGTLTLTVAPE